MEDKLNLWNYSVEDIAKGYIEEDKSYQCIICGKHFEKGLIYNRADELFDAFGATRRHVKNEHGQMVDYLLGQKVNLTGISEVQNQLLSLMSEGKNDKEIGVAMGIAQSTVRNHRFKLREKEKQAKLFLALMKSLEDKTNNSIVDSSLGVISEVHASANMIDDRYSITDQEYQKIIGTYMDENGALKQIPSKEKRKIIILREIMKNFKANVVYTEREVNKVLARIYEEDYVALRRALIEYGFMDRANDGKSYRVKE